MDALFECLLDVHVLLPGLVRAYSGATLNVA